MYRPYPNADRALRQIDRHADEAPPLSDAPERPLSPFTIHITERAEAAAQALGASLTAALLKMRQPPVDEYRLSTR
ncbi:hypothetical protein [Streptomyces sp. NPDC003857]